MKELVTNLHQHLGLSFTPAGIWELDENNKKQKIDVNRKDNLEWTDYPDDNMARVFLEHEYLVIDIDGAFSHESEQGIHLTEGQILPLTFYTITSDKSKAHLYYTFSGNENLPNRTQSLIGRNIDTFTYGTLFEGHTMKNHELHAHPVVEFPREHPYAKTLLEVPITSSSHHGTLYPVTSYRTLAAITVLSDYKNLKRGPVNSALRVLIPKSYIPKGISKLMNIPITYSLINDMATKLICCAELSTEDVRDFLVFFIREMHGLNPEHGGLLDKNIMATLPVRDAILLYDPELELTIAELLELQPLTQKPIFKTSYQQGKTTQEAYIQVDKTLMEPLMFGESYLHSPKMITNLSPERIIFDENGRKIGWDDNVPLVETHSCPYSPPIDSLNGYNRINLYVRTEYQKQSSPREISNLSSNILGRLVISTVPQEHVSYVMMYYAHLFFSDRPPLVSLLMASPHAGAGKSLLTVEVPYLLIGDAVATINGADTVKGWSDIILGKRLLVIEDMNKSEEWERAYPFMKQQSGNAARVLDGKYGAVKSGQVRLSTGGSSNYRLSIDQDDRRMFCLEPAHRDSNQPNLPLSNADAQKVTRLMASKEYSEEVQLFMDHLYYVYKQGLTMEEEQSLYERAPNTVYKDKWKIQSKGYVRRIVESIPYPHQLHEIVRMDEETNMQHLANLYQYLLYMVKDDTHKVGLSWKWFAEFMEFVNGSHRATSKKSVGDALGIEQWATNIGDRYKLPVGSGLPYGMEDYPASGLVITLSEEAVEGYKEILKELMAPVGSHREIDVA